MRRDESLSGVMHEPQQIRSACGVELDLPMTQEKDGIDVAEAWATAGWLSRRHLGMTRDDVRIGANVRVP
jgi:hypothetical protein